MAKQSTKGTTKAPRGKKAAAAPVEQPGLMGEAEPMRETPEATAPAAEELPPAVPGEAAAVPPEAPESGLETGAVPEGDSLPEDQAVPEGDSKPEGRRAVVRSPKGLNLRAGPALNYDVLEVLPDGMEVLALDLPRGAAVPGWELVDTGGRTGWASARFLRPRKVTLLAFCRLDGLSPEEEGLLAVLYDAAVGYMTQAGIREPPKETPRRAQYDLCVNYLVLDSWDRRDVSFVGAASSENPAFRRLLNQMKLTEPDVSNLDTSDLEEGEPS